MATERHLMWPSILLINSFILLCPNLLSSIKLASCVAGENWGKANNFLMTNYLLIPPNNLVDLGFLILKSKDIAHLVKEPRIWLSLGRGTPHRGQTLQSYPLLTS